MTEKDAGSQYKTVEDHTPQAPVADAAPSEAGGFVAIYEEHFGFVWRALRRLGATAEDADDLAHDVFVVVLRRLPGCDLSRPLRPWLFGIALRVLSERRRSAPQRREVTGEIPDSAVVGPSAEERVDAEEARRRVLAALQALHLDQRVVLVMHDLEGFSMPEIAGELAIPLNTGYSRLRLARERCAEMLRNGVATRKRNHHEGVDACPKSR